MTRAPRPRNTINFSHSVHHRLNKYALAASAAGVGALALAQAAEAKIVYVPAYHVIGKNSSFRIDLNHDGIADLIVHNDQFVSKSRRSNFIGADPQAPSGGIMQTDTIMYFASFAALKRGARVGYGADFVLPQKGHGILVAQCTSARGTNSAPPCYGETYNVLGDWRNVKNRYLGVKFLINGLLTHYGWVRLSVVVSRKPFKATAVLTGYAYETIPGKAIIAGATKGPDEAEPTALNTPTPEPATLGMLALGAPGLSIWRRRESMPAALEGI
jgi:hypothetical protein